MKRLRGKLLVPPAAGIKAVAKSAPKVAGRQAAAPHLSPDEHALWRHVAVSISPIKVKSRITRRPASADGDQDDARVPARRPGPHHDTSSNSETSAAAFPPMMQRKSAVAPALADFDARKVKKIAKGRAGIEARLDLHGLRQDDAHVRLRVFLRQAYADGLKLVLVITGKGRDVDDPQASYADTLERPARGVLRRNVPRWLAEPELRGLVVSFASAAPRHGGEGAFYIELRRQR